MINLNGIVVLIRVAETSSFTEAGVRLGLTASAVSKAISRLEQDLGVRLLNRTTRHVGLTEEGRNFYEHCRHVLAEFEDAQARISQSNATPRGKLRVLLPVVFGRRFVVPHLPRFIERFPELTLDIEMSGRTADLSEEGIDVAVRIGHLPDSYLIAQRLCEVHFVACASPSYLRRHGTPRTPDDLGKHRCLNYSTPWMSRPRDWQFAHEGRAFSKSVGGVMQFNSAESLQDAVVAGAGIAMIGSHVAANAVHEGKLRVVLKDYVGPARPVSAIHQSGRQGVARVRAFLGLLRQAIPSPEPWRDII